MKKFKRLVIRIAYPIARLYWWVLRPKTNGVKCAVFYNEKILLIKLNYGHKLWTVPGGGVHRGESTATAACREVLEEVGIKIQNPIHIGTYSQIIEYKNDTVDVFTAESNTEAVTIDGIEASEAKWFPLDKIPTDVSRQTHKIIALYKDYSKHSI